MTRKLLGVWFHLEKNVQGGPATIGRVQDNEVYGSRHTYFQTGEREGEYRYRVQNSFFATGVIILVVGEENFFATTVLRILYGVI